MTFRSKLRDVVAFRELFGSHRSLGLLGFHGRTVQARVLRVHMMLSHNFSFI